MESVAPAIVSCPFSLLHIRVLAGLKKRISRSLGCQGGEDIPALEDFAVVDQPGEQLSRFPPVHDPYSDHIFSFL